jgi:glycosyltransferase involved in cell wall biosynthesis
MFDHLKVAIVHDWLVDYGGAEQVLEQIIRIFPQAQLFCVVDFLPDDARSFILEKQTHPSFIQNLPFARRFFRYYLPLMPLAIEQMDLRGFDLVISSSHAVAKGVITSPDQVHIAYIHSPMRYIWDLQGAYLNQSITSILGRLVFHYLRIWDVTSATRIDRFIANSHFIRRRILKTYRRKAKVIYPPVHVQNFPLKTKPADNFYLSVCRLVPYKRVDLIVDAFAQMPDRQLVIIGDGVERKTIERKLTPNITYLGYQSQSKVREYMQKAKGFVFAGVEDFGIAPLEALSCGTPVIALGRGGLKETIVAKTGVLFAEQTVESLQEGIRRFEQQEFDPIICHQYAQKFAPDNFCRQFKEKVSHWLRKIRACLKD